MLLQGAPTCEAANAGATQRRQYCAAGHWCTYTFKTLDYTSKVPMSAWRHEYVVEQRGRYAHSRGGPRARGACRRRRHGGGGRHGAPALWTAPPALPSALPCSRRCRETQQPPAPSPVQVTTVSKHHERLDTRQRPLVTARKVPSAQLVTAYPGAACMARLRQRGDHSIRFCIEWLEQVCNVRVERESRVC